MNLQNVSLVFVVSAPSGAGKTTLCEKLRAEFSRLVYSVSCTTRAPREGEVDGQAYHFLDEATFLRQRDEGRFLEYARVHGAWYGTPRDLLEGILAEGGDVLLDIDVQGAHQLRDAVQQTAGDGALRRSLVDVFITPPDSDVLAARLRGRAKDDEATIERRLKAAGEEMKAWSAYTYMIVNDDLDEAYENLRAIYLAEHRAVARLHPDPV